MYCAIHVQRPSAAALDRTFRASSAVSGGPGGRPTALRCAPAAEARLPRSRSAANRAVAQQRGSTVARRAARCCILAAAGADDNNDDKDDAFAAEEAEPVLAPQECTLLLRKLYKKVDELRRELFVQKRAAQSKLDPAQEQAAVCEEELKLSKLLSLRCLRAGDAEAAKHYASGLARQAKQLREAKRKFRTDCRHG